MSQPEAEVREKSYFKGVGLGTALAGWLHPERRICIKVVVCLSLDIFIYLLNNANEHFLFSYDTFYCHIKYLLKGGLISLA